MPNSTQAQSETLFRDAGVLSTNAKRYGSTLKLGPAPWRWSIALCVMLSLIFLVFLFFAHYTRRIPTTGQVVIDRGIARVHAPQAGVVNAVLVQEGQWVKQGDLLFTIDSQKRSSQGAIQDEVLNKLNERKASLSQASEREVAILNQRKQELKNRIVQVTAQLQQNVARQILAKRRIQLAQTQVERHQELIQEGFISPAARDDKAVILVEAQNSLAILGSENIELEKQQLELQSQLDLLPLQSQNVQAQMGREIAALEASSAEQQDAKEIHVQATKAGRISTVTVRPGQMVTTENPVVDIVPSDARYLVELYAPSKGIGFIEKSQEVALRFEAYPYQKFGVQKGKVEWVSLTTASSKQINIPLSEEENYYRLRVELVKPTILAYGKEHPLQIGMKVEADVRSDTRTIWEWLMEPLYGLRGKL